MMPDFMELRMSSSRHFTGRPLLAVQFQQYWNWTAEKHKLWKLLEAELFADEDNSPQDIAEI